MLLHRSSYVESTSSELPGRSESFAVGPSKWEQQRRTTILYRPGAGCGVAWLGAARLQVCCTAGGSRPTDLAEGTAFSLSSAHSGRQHRDAAAVAGLGVE